MNFEPAFVAAFLVIGLSTTTAARHAQEAELLPNHPLRGSGFGEAVACSGTLAIIGAPLMDGYFPAPGAAYVFNMTTGAQIAELLPNDGVQDRTFGWSVAISGTTAVVGAFTDDENGPRAGAAYLFDAVTGVQLAKLLPTDGAPGDLFGFAVAISGTTAVVSALFDEDNGEYSGSVYLFDSQSGAQIAKLLPADGEENDQFGRSVAIDGTRLIVGASDDSDNGDYSGSAYIFDVSTGIQIHKVFANDATGGGRFGESVGISGTTAIVGAYTANDNGHHSGSAYLIDIVTGEVLSKLVPNLGGAEDLFGFSAAISGTTAIVGARFADDSGENSGAAYVFDATTGQQIAEFLPRDGTAGDNLGNAVAIDGTTALVGAPYGSGADIESGSVYSFDTDQAIAVPYCFGSGGGTPCPCGNSGAPGRGCGNSAFGAGAKLWTTGSPCVTSDDLVLHIVDSRPLQPGLFFQGDDRLNGGHGLVFGDGLRCAGGTFLRLEIVFTDGGGNAASTIPLAATARLTGGDVKRYQWWYLDPGTSPCGTGFNLSNGIEVIWAP